MNLIKILLITVLVFSCKSKQCVEPDLQCRVLHKKWDEKGYFVYKVVTQRGDSGILMTSIDTCIDGVITIKGRGNGGTTRRR